MAQLVEFSQRDVFLEGLDEDVARDVSALTALMIGRTIDAVLALAAFEQASSELWAHFNEAREHRHDSWERDRQAERAREQELAIRSPAPDVPWHDERYRAWENEIREQARRDVVRSKWATSTPEGYLSRLPQLHARTFVLALAQVARALGVLARLDLGDAKDEVTAAREGFSMALPTLVPIRHSIEHAEDRMRSLGKFEKPLTLHPVSNAIIEAPGGGALVSDSLNGRDYLCTVADGSCAEIEVSDATAEAARAAVQRVLDALPWRRSFHGYVHYTPMN